MSETNIRISPHALFWILFFAISLALLFLFSKILLPFVAGFILAYLFHPVVDRVERLGLARGASAFLIVGLVSVTLIAALALVLPLIINQLGELIQNLPAHIEKTQAYLEQNYGHYLEPLRQQLNLDKNNAHGSSELSQNIAQNITPWVINQLQALVSGGLALFNSIALLVLTPVVAFFMLRDWNSMISSVNRVLPRQDAGTIRRLMTEIDWTISAYLRGTLIVLLIVSGFYMMTLELIGLNYGLLIGLGAGLISFVPYLGSTTGFLVAGGVAISQYYPNYTLIGVVLGVFVLGQVVEGNILTPNIVGNKVRLHPVWLLFALIASGYLLGFTGLLISVPLAAVIGVLIRHLMKQYFASELYQDPGSKDVSQTIIVP